MKVAFCNRPNWNNPLGGDGVQMLKTKEKLEELYDIQIDIITNPQDLTSLYDIVHIFNYATINITNQYFERAKMLKLKIASSSIFWEYKYAITPLPFRLGFYRDFVDEAYLKKNIYLNKIVSLITNNPLLISRKFKKYLQNFIINSDLILPNSKEEGELLLKYANLDNAQQNLLYRNKMRVVYNGVDVSNVEIMDQDLFSAKYNIPENYILQVSRIQYLKNQLNLLYALKDDKTIPIVFVGKVVDYKYFEQLRLIGEKRGNVFFLSEVDHNDIYSFYFYAKTHILLSLRESPGLVSLEALSQGCPIVVSDKRFAPVDTYFNSNVEVVNPLNNISIREGVIKSYKKERTKIDISQYSWEYAAKQTYNAYLSLF